MTKVLVQSVFAAVFLAGAAAAEQPPYPLVEGDKGSFEPSAAAYDPQTDRVLVLSDKDATLYRYQVRSGRLVLPAGEKHEPLKVAGAIRKFESLTPIPNAPGEYLAATAFDRPDPNYRRVVRFRFAKTGAISATDVAIDDTANADAVAKATKQRWFKIEGLTLNAAGDRAFLAVRNVGPDYKHPRDVVLLLRCPFDGKKIGMPEATLSFTTKSLKDPEGASDLFRDPKDGSYWILTSRESGQKRPTDHGGHLFHVPAALLDGPPSAESVELPAAVQSFRAKSEGLTRLPGGEFVVTFDDDADGWKKLYEGYAPNRGMAAVFTPAGR